MLLWVIREYRKWGGRTHSDRTEGDLSRLRSKILAGRALAERVFALEDWEFVSAKSTPEIQRLLEKERRGVAILCLKRMREQVTEVMRLHRSMVRYKHDLSVRNEAKLALEYYLFFPIYYFLLSLTWLRGPFRTREMVGYSIRAMSRVCVAFGNALYSRTWSVEGTECALSRGASSR